MINRLESGKKEDEKEEEEMRWLTDLPTKLSQQDRTRLFIFLKIQIGIYECHPPNQAE